MDDSGRDDCSAESEYHFFDQHRGYPPAPESEAEVPVALLDPSDLSGLPSWEWEEYTKELEETGNTNQEPPTTSPHPTIAFERRFFLRYKDNDIAECWRVYGDDIWKYYGPPTFYSAEEAAEMESEWERFQEKLVDWLEANEGDSRGRESGYVSDSGYLGDSES